MMLFESACHDEILVTFGDVGLSSTTSASYTFSCVVEHLKKLDVVNVVNGLSCVQFALDASLFFQTYGGCANLCQVPAFSLAHADQIALAIVWHQ